MVCSHGLTMQMTGYFKPRILPVIPDHRHHVMLNTLRFISNASYSSFSETMRADHRHSLRKIGITRIKDKTQGVEHDVIGMIWDSW